MTTLATKDREALEALEEVIERGLDSFIEVGNALLQVRKEKLYRGEYDTFEIYCDLRWGMNRGRAYQMIQAAEVAGNLSTSVYISKPSTEFQVRPLAKLEPPEQIKAWNAAVDTAKKPGEPTHEEVQAAVEAIAPKKAERINYKPSNGMQYAEMAIANLEKIQPNDLEREAAFNRVERWLVKNK